MTMARLSMTKVLAGALLALACSGCVTDAERRAADEARCRNYGFRGQSEGLANCLLQIDLDRSAALRYRMDTAFGPPWPYYGYYGRRW